MKIKFSSGQSSPLQPVQVPAEGAEEEILDEEEAASNDVVVPIPADFRMEESSQELMNSLCTTVYKHGDDRTKARAMLCSVFFKSINDQFYAARDTMLMSHLQVPLPGRPAQSWTITRNSITAAPNQGCRLPDGKADHRR